VLLKAGLTRKPSRHSLVNQSHAQYPCTKPNTAKRIPASSHFLTLCARAGSKLSRKPYSHTIHLPSQSRKKATAQIAPPHPPAISITPKLSSCPGLSTRISATQSAEAGFIALRPAPRPLGPCLRHTQSADASAIAVGSQDAASQFGTSGTPRAIPSLTIGIMKMMRYTGR
jgi:hypothetical protein